LPGNGIFKVETKGPKRLRGVKDDQTLRCREAEFSKQRQRGRNGFEGGSSDYLLRRPNPALRARLAVHRDRLSNVSTCIHRKRPNVGRFARRCESVDMPRFDAFEPGLFEPKSPLRGNGIFRAETKRPKRPWRFKDAGAETNLARQPTRRGGRVRDRHRLLSC
jgi:hypothetical protein